MKINKTINSLHNNKQQEKPPHNDVESGHQ